MMPVFMLMLQTFTFAPGVTFSAPNWILKLYGDAADDYRCVL